MALKKLLTAEEFEKLTDAQKEFYVESDGKYKLDLEGEEDTSALKRAKDREAQLRKDAEKQLAELQKKLDENNDLDARKRGDIETLEKSWKSKMDEAVNSEKKNADKYKSILAKHLVDDVAANLARELNPDAPSLFIPHIKSRLMADFDGDAPTTRILDAANQISALSLADLKNEFLANKEFSGSIKASQASGGAGASKVTTSGGASSSSEKPDLSKVTPKAAVEHIRSLIEGN